MLRKVSYAVVKAAQKVVNFQRKIKDLGPVELCEHYLAGQIPAIVAKKKNVLKDVVLTLVKDIEENGCAEKNHKEKLKDYEKAKKKAKKQAASKSESIAIAKLYPTYHKVGYQELRQKDQIFDLVKKDDKAVLVEFDLAKDKLSSNCGVLSQKGEKAVKITYMNDAGEVKERRLEEQERLGLLICLYPKEEKEKETATKGKQRNKGH